MRVSMTSSVFIKLVNCTVLVSPPGTRQNFCEESKKQQQNKTHIQWKKMGKKDDGREMNEQ